MLPDQTAQLLITLNNDNSSDAEVNNAIGIFLEAFNGSSEYDKEIALLELVRALDAATGKNTEMLANLIGYFFESGFKPPSVFSPIIDYFEKLLTQAVSLWESFAIKMNSRPAPLNDDDEPDIEELFEKHFEASAETAPAAVRAWKKFEETWCCGIALFSVSDKARQAARKLRPMASQISEYSGGGHWFDLMLAVFDQEPFVAIDLEKRIGVKGKMSGVVENFQLHVLLMDIFPVGWFSAGGIDQAIVENAKGNGPQGLDRSVTGRWNMYNWTIAAGGRTISDYSDMKLTDHWIWGEGRPEDIAVFEGQRVILLGKPLYERNWGAQLMFGHLKAGLTVEQKMSKTEVNEFLARLAAAPRIEAEI